MGHPSAGVIVSIGLSGGLGGGGGRIGSLHTGNLYLEDLWGLPAKDSLAVGGGSGLLGSIGGCAGLGYGCGIICNFGLISLPSSTCSSLFFSR